MAEPEYEPFTQSVHEMTQMLTGLTHDELIDYRNRLHAAMILLDEFAMDASRKDPHSIEVSRFRGKISGITLALDYLRSYDKG